MPRSGHQRLVGRDRELALLRAAFEATEAGRGAFLVFHGQFGSGKSLLLRAAAEEAERYGLTVVSARVARLDQHSAMAPLLAVLSAGPHPVVDAVEAESLAALADRPTHWGRLTERLCRLVEQRAAHSPIVIVLDDLHWADELTVAALETLLPRLTELPVLWLAAYADFPVARPAGDGLDRLLTSHAEVVRLPSVDEEASAELGARLLGARPGDVRRLTSAAGGSPYLIGCLAHLLRAEGRVRSEDGEVRVLGRHLPAGLGRATAPVVSALSQPTRDLLQVGAVLGRQFSLRQVATLTGRSTMELAPAAQEAVAAGLLEDDGAAFRYRSLLVHLAVYGSLLGPVRRALHSEAARLCVSEERPCTETLGHLVLAGAEEDLDEGVTRLTLLERAEQAVPPRQREELSGLLLDRLRLYEPLSAAPVVTAVRLFLAAGQTARAGHLLDAALTAAGWETEAEAEAFAELLEVLLRLGGTRLALRHLRRARKATRPPAGYRAWLMLLEARCLLAHSAADADRAAALSRAAVSVAERTGDRASVALGTVVLSLCARHTGDIAESIRLADEAMAHGPAGAERSFGWGSLWLSLALCLAGRPLEAAEALQAWCRDAHATDVWTAPRWHLAKSLQLWHSGRLEDAARAAHSGLEACDRLADPAARRVLLAVLALVTTVRGDLEAAAGHVAALSAHPQAALPGLTETVCAFVTALHLDAAGDPRAAMRQLAKVWSAPRRYLWFLTADPMIVPHMVRIARGAGADEQAAEAVAVARHLARLNPGIPSLAAVALHAHGLYGSLAAPLHRAVRVLRTGSHPLALASALEDAAAVTHAQGDLLRATEILQEAHRIYVASGAGLGAERVRRRLRSAQGRIMRELSGAAEGTRTPPGRPAAENTPHTGGDWKSLTPSEIRVVRLVAEGLTNRETAQRLAVSAHTVDSHLRRAFAKLGVSRRIELARYVLAHGSADPVPAHSSK
ncbi:LuxR family transcriptional regulator [Streptomyces sp. GbtcB6]|uniref:helix-turn-helix transcriptional regulator n=1 Tax=Streptomyces sp. GbtcB6 TaxID=2824751 RepID=UPI001C304645|nr:LuxR family transcriptional regulator [Streptomyces sp. GbtcB6]